jgi:hypothetical protein
MDQHALNEFEDEDNFEEEIDRLELDDWSHNFFFILLFLN